jgi:uncharacterized repeat protein (TIGR02543 family)
MTAAAVFDSGFRNSHRDSFGNIFKMSWFAQMDYLMAQSNFVWADGSPAGVSGYTAIRDLLVNNWGTEIQTYGDSIEYHHHFMIYNGTWQRYDNGPDAGYPEYQMHALDHMIIDRNFYPSSWRSGDWIMPPALSSWLEQWMPFDYTPQDYTPTAVWYPVHPSGMDRWQTNCLYGYPVSSLNSSFAYARDNGNAIFSICTHDNGNMQAQIAWLQYNLERADADEATYPNVSFKYVTAREAMQQALGFTDFAPPTFTITRSGSTYTIVSSEPLWKNHPYVALKYTDGTYSHMSATPTGINTWIVTPPRAWELDAVGVGASDLHGNPGAATVPVTLEQYALTVGTVGSGSVTKSPDRAMYASGTPVQLTAVPAAGWSFSSWSGSLTGSANPASLTVTGDMTVTATFIQNGHSLTVSTVGSGSVSKAPDQASYNSGDVVTLTAVPAAGWSFGSWSGSLTGSANPASLTITGDMTVTATFTQNAYSLTVSTVGSGSVAKISDYMSTFGYATQGTYGIEPLNNLIAGYETAPATSGTLTKITARLSGIWAPGKTMKAKCALYYASNKTLVPNSETNEITWTNEVNAAWYSFDYAGRTHPSVTAGVTYIIVVWASASGGGSINVAFNYDYTDPTFYGIAQSLSYGSAFPSSLLSPVNTGRKYSIYATYSPDQATYVYGDVVQLTAVPAAGWSFSSWSGSLTGSANPASLTITGDMTVTATFLSQNSYSLTVSTVGSGSVSKSPDQATYASGTVVTLTATAAPGWSFSGWSGDVVGSVNPVQVTMDGAKSVTATFTQDAYSVSVTVLPSSAAGTVTPNPAGPYHYGDVVVLTESPSLGYTFSGWSGDGSGSGSTRSVTVTGNMSVTATFTQDQYTLTVNVAGAGCSVTKSPDQATYTYGTSVQLTPVAASGWTFSGWSGDLTGTAVPGTVSMTGSKTVTATFTQNEYSLTVSTVGSGSVVKSPSQGTYHYGDVVQLTATPAAGYSFSGWSSGLTGNPASVTITGDTVVTAYFAQIEYTLTVSASPAEGGSVTKNPDLAHFHYNDVVQLTAISSAGYSFAGWSGGLSGNPASFTITGNMEVTAYFTQNEYSLTVTVAPSSAAGSVSASIPGPYHLNDIVTLTPTANLGYTFSSWSGDGINGAGNTRVVTISGNMSVTATFTQNTYTLTVTTVGSGSVNLNNNGPYYYGDIVELTAVPSAGWSFDHWGGDLSGSINPTTILMDGDKAVTTTFTQNVYTLTVTTTGSGSVSLDNSGPYHYGDVVELTAVPVTGWSFQSWSGELSGSVNPITILIDGNKAVTATFVQNAYTLTVSTLGIGSVVKVPDQASYHYGDVVELTAVPSTGWSFDHWSQDLTGSFNPATLTITGNITVTAHFTENTYTLTVNVVGTGCSVSRDNNGPYHYNDVVHLTANAAVGWAFSQWSGALTGNANPAALTITGDMAVTATFAENLYNLTITVSSGGGSVSKSPDQATYTYGTIVTLTASPVAGWSFSHWSGDLSGSTSPAYLTIDGDKSVTATFTQNEYTLTISTSGSGTVSMDKSTPYHYGDVVQLTAVPAAGWSFSSWSGSLTGSANPASLTITGNMSVTATFTQNTYRITVTQGANGVISPETIDVEYGSDKAFTITPDNGYHIFDVVVDDIPQGAVSSYLFRNVVANHTISASFAIDVYEPFSVVSNSTISELAFNSTSQVLSFTAGGPSGTTGFSNVTISKTLIADVSGLEVYLDGTKTGYVVSDLTTSWLIYITYNHSTHKIAMNFAPPPSARADYVPYIALAAILGLIVAFMLTVFAKRRRKSSQSEARARP